jgi:hypothetical protein
LQESSFARIPKLFHALCKMNPQIRIMFLKIFLNAWCTSHRAHETVRQHFIFGCLELPDALHHYIGCEALWYRIYAGLKIPPVTDLCERIGVGIVQNSFTFIPVAVAFDVYHSFKHSELSVDIIVAASMRAYGSRCALVNEQLPILQPSCIV